MNRLFEKVSLTVEKYNMLSRGDSVLVGLSGGADSTALLHSLCTISKQIGFTVECAHVNHCIRGEQAMRDELFAQALCDRLGVKLHRFTVDVPTVAAKRGMGLEECGRECRYDCFYEVSDGGKRNVATAHTLSDSAETVIFNLARGCGVDGLRGIPPVRKDERGMRIIRPLIGCTREDVEGYCAENGLEYVTDSTNADKSYSRNRIRLEVIPALREINGGFYEAVERLSQCAAQESEWLDAQAGELLAGARLADGALSRAVLLAGAQPVISRALMAYIRECTGHTAQYRHIELICRHLQRGSGAQELVGGKRFRIKDGRCFIDDGESSEATERVGSNEWSIPLRELLETAGETDKTELIMPDGRLVHIYLTDMRHYCANKVNKKTKNDILLFKSTADCDIITDNTLLRLRQPGDRYQPVGSEHHRKLKKLLCDSAVPREKRDRLLLIASGSEVLWAEGFGAAHGWLPMGDDDRLLLIEMPEAVKVPGLSGHNC